jgi:hypothetical protein
MLAFPNSPLYYHFHIPLTESSLDDEFKQNPFCTKVQGARYVQM